MADLHQFLAFNMQSPTPEALTVRVDRCLLYLPGTKKYKLRLHNPNPEQAFQSISRFGAHTGVSPLSKRIAPISTPIPTDENRSLRIKKQIRNDTKNIKTLINSQMRILVEDYGHKKSHPEVTNFHTMVPKAGLEPARISTVDFESTASTDFATSAL
jgi:hypothetical protein